MFVAGYTWWRREMEASTIVSKRIEIISSGGPYVYIYTSRILGEPIIRYEFLIRGATKQFYFIEWKEI